MRRLTEQIVGAQPSGLDALMAQVATTDPRQLTVNLPRQHGRRTALEQKELLRRFLTRNPSRDIPREFCCNGYVHGAEEHDIGCEHHPGIPHEHEAMPVLAARWAYLDLRHGRLWSLNQHCSFEIFEQAHCKNFAHHEAPEPDCTCGFYAVPADQIVEHRPVHWGSGWREDYTSGSFPVVLSVQLEGRICIHDRGYRAQYQRVLGIELPHNYSSRVDGIPTAVSIRRIGEHFGVDVTVAE
jgi:hypothetical protein